LPGSKQTWRSKYFWAISSDKYGLPMPQQELSSFGNRRRVESEKCYQAG
jgi:hypothetical protein